MRKMGTADRADCVMAFFMEQRPLGMVARCGVIEYPQIQKTALRSSKK